MQSNEKTRIIIGPSSGEQVSGSLQTRQFMVGMLWNTLVTLTGN